MVKIINVGNQFVNTWIYWGYIMIYPSHGQSFNSDDLKKYLDKINKIKLYP